MPAVNYVIFGCSSSRTIPVVIIIQQLHWRKNIIAVITQGRVIDENVSNSKLKTELCILVDYSYLPEFFKILAIAQNYLSIYPPSFFNIQRVIIFLNFPR